MTQIVKILPHAWSYTGYTMPADDLATQGARSSAAMVLTYFSRLITAIAPQGLNVYQFLTFKAYLVRCGPQVASLRKQECDLQT